MRNFLIVTTMLIAALVAACAENRNANNANTAARNENRVENANTSARETGPPDGWITTKTKLALIADKRTSGFETDVDTHNGVVTLSGKVDTAEAKTAATDVARTVNGVREVDNKLQVVPDAKRKEVNAADDKIEDGIKTAMKNDARLKDTSLSAKSNAGVVVLTGSADTPEQLLEAAQTAGRVPGVKSVDTRQVTVKQEEK